jgi:imidazolonepropionase-like amidohydrolase
MTVLPGLFDCHTHLCEMIPVPHGEVGPSFVYHYLFSTTADRAVQGVVNARDFLNAGFTTVRDVGNAGNWADVAVKGAIDKGLVPGPKTLVSGRIIAPFGGQGRVTHEHPELMHVDYFEADTRDEMLKAIRQNLHYGVDWIKIVVDDQPYLYSVEDVRFMVEEAGRAGVKIAAHTMTNQGARNAILGGVESIEHGFFLDDEVLELAKEKGAWLVGTDFSQEIIDVYDMQEWREIVVDRLRRAHRLGVRMAFGSDIVVEVPGHDRGSAALTLLDTWVEAGVPAANIVRALTVDAAELLGMSDERGRIAEGLAADLIAVPGNPLEDVTVLRQVSFVMVNGTVFRNDVRANSEEETVQK